MKKVLLLVAVAIMSLTMSAQVFVGGGLGVGMTTTVVNKQTDTGAKLGFEFDGGYKLNSKLAVAGQFSYNYWVKNCHELVVGPYARYTFFENKRFSLFGEGGINYIYVANGYFNEQTDYAIVADGSGFNFVLRPGVAVKLSDNFALTGRLTLFEYRWVNKCNVVNLALSTGLHVGFAYDF